MTKTAFVTGANRGIGRAIGLRLARLDYDLVLLARDESALATVAAECTALGSQVLPIAGELAEEHFIDSAVAAALERFSTVDVLVNNAGAASHAAVQNADLAAWQAVMDVNFRAVVALSNKLLPCMIDAKSGAVINISSISGRSTSAGSAIYSASKFALNGFTECMYEDVREHGIKVSSIMPGFVATELTQGMGMKAAKMIGPDDIADAVQYILATSAAVCPTEIVLRPQLRP